MLQEAEALKYGEGKRRFSTFILNELKANNYSVNNRNLKYKYNLVEKAGDALLDNEDFQKVFKTLTEYFLFQSEIIK